jgi:uncharacterized membrane protein
VVPFIVLVIATLIFRGAGLLGLNVFDLWSMSVRTGLFVMFLLTASAHWGKRRADLIAMVPTTFPRPDLMVTLTGVLELLGAAGLLWRPIAPIAATCLASLLIAIFPANVRAARDHLKIGDAPATPLPLRTLLQVIFIAALAIAGFPRLFGLSAP